jgi:polyadenylation factor subunit 2
VLREVKRIHECAISAMEFNRKGNILITGDKLGNLKFLKTKMLFDVKEVEKPLHKTDSLKHTEAIRGIAVAPSDLKLVTGSDDKLLKMYDFTTA